MSLFLIYVLYTNVYIDSTGDFWNHWCKLVYKCTVCTGWTAGYVFLARVRPDYWPKNVGWPTRRRRVVAHSRGTRHYTFSLPLALVFPLPSLPLSLFSSIFLFLSLYLLPPSVIIFFLSVLSFFSFFPVLPSLPLSLFYSIFLSSPFFTFTPREPGILLSLSP